MSHCKCYVQHFMGLPTEIIINWFKEFKKTSLPKLPDIKDCSLRDAMPCSLTKICRLFGVSCCLRHLFIFILGDYGTRRPDYMVLYHTQKTLIFTVLEISNITDRKYFNNNNQQPLVCQLFLTDTAVIDTESDETLFRNLLTFWTIIRRWWSYFTSQAVSPILQ